MHSPIDMAYQNLGDAIIPQAVTDYRNALNGITFEKKSPESIINEIEKFFRSTWYRTLTKVDGEYLIEQLRKEQICESP